MKRGRVDANQKEITQFFRGRGFAVAITSDLGNGFPDLVVSKAGFNILIEIKDGTKPPSQRRLTDDEEAFHAGWKGHIAIVKCEQDVIWLDSFIKKRAENELSYLSIITSGLGNPERMDHQPNIQAS